MLETEVNRLDREIVAHQSSPNQKPVRILPGLILAAMLVILRYLLPSLAPDAELGPFPIPLIGMLGGLLASVGILVWWLFFSRAGWRERVGAVLLIILTVVLTRMVVHESIRGGMMGMMVIFYSLPVLALALAGWAAVTQRLSLQARRALLPVVLLLAATPLALLRTAGLFGGGSEFHWRWTQTPEERLLAEAKDEPLPVAAAAATPEVAKEAPAKVVEPSPAVSPTATPAAAAAAAPTPARMSEWPGFRGARRDGIVRGVQIKTDWAASPPVELWRKPIGPGWSSFAVQGDWIYTQEQRGEDEIVGCYKLSTGEPVWRHRDPVRFWESNGGAGPRATPTLSRDRVYAFGATGILNALHAGTGKLLWSRNAATDTGRKVPDWGFSSSPLVIDDLVVVAVSGTLAAYDAATGKPRWTGPAHGGSYSSPHRATINGAAQILILHGDGVSSLAPATGDVLWEHAWNGGPIVQPTQLSGGDLLISTGGASGGLGVRRLAIEKGAEGWSVQERWTSNGLKPYFNDYIVQKGHAYGFDGNILACIGLEDGKRKWKGGRYGNGQLVLLPDQDLLLVLSEEGELALVSATPDQFKELARIPALQGKTWNHPVIVGDTLLVRNGEQMAAFRLPIAN